LLASTSSVKPLSRRSISEHVEASCPTSTSWPRNLSRHTDQPCLSSGHHCEKRQRDKIIISLSPMVPIYCSIGARSHSLPISAMVRVWVKGQQTAERHSLAKSCITSISCRRWTRATRRFTRIVLYAEMDDQSHKLVNVVCQTSIVASIINSVRPRTAASLLNIQLCRTKLTTRCDDQRAVAKS